MNTSKQLKALINNKAKKHNLNPQILLTRFFIERLLERVSLSKYKNNFILKGGILISAMVGVDFRMTKDMDFTIKHLPSETAKTRHTESIFENPTRTIELLEFDDNIKSLWSAYSRQFSYATMISFDEVMQEIKSLLAKAGIQ